MSGIEIAEKIHKDFFVGWPPHCYSIEQKLARLKKKLYGKELLTIVFLFHMNRKQGSNLKSGFWDFMRGRRQKEGFRNVDKSTPRKIFKVVYEIVHLKNITFQSFFYQPCFQDHDFRIGGQC